jgi:hypothetical protein
MQRDSVATTLANEWALPDPIIENVQQRRELDQVIPQNLH